MARVGGYLDYLAAMLDRVTAGLAIGRAEADAAVIARHILSTRSTALNERTLYQRPSWSWLRDRERGADAFRELRREARRRAMAASLPDRSSRRRQIPRGAGI
jgi:hypothetical protein